MRQVLIASLSLAALAAASPALAQTTQTSSDDVAGAAAATAVDQVVVVAGRRPEPLAQVGESVTVLTLPQIRQDQETVVSDILARTPGVTYSRNGGPGAVTSVYIRGAESDQTTVLIDGVKLNDPSSPGGGFNFADLLTGDISRIEVLRGPQSTLYGSQAIGGVVNIVTAAPTRDLQGYVQAEGGSYATGEAKAAIGGKDGPLSVQTAVESYTTAGVSAFDSRLGGRETDGYRNTALTARLGYDLTPTISVDGRVYYAETRDEFDGFPPPNYVFADDPEFGRTQELVAYAGVNAALGRLQNRFAVQYTDTERQNLDLTQSVTPFTFLASGKNTREEYQGTYPIAPGYVAVFGAEHERQSYSTASPSDYDPAPAFETAAATINSGYGQLQAEVIKGLNLTGGVRYDDHSAFGGHATGQAAAAWTLPWSVLGGATILRASWGQGFKAPSLYELYSDYGNPTLKPEESDGYDGGVEQHFLGSHGVLQVTGFARDTKNQIVFVSCPVASGINLCATEPYGFYQNLAKTHADGVEVSGGLTQLAGFDLTGNFTYTDAEDRSPGATYGKQLSRRPQDAANVEAAYTLPFRLRTAVALRYAGASFDDAANTRRNKSYTLTDVRLSYPLGHGLELYGRVENLFDKSYETIFQYGQLGRAGYAGLRAVF